MSVSDLYHIWCKSNSELLTFFRNPTWRPSPCWIFKISEFGTFYHLNGVVLELCSKFGLNICYKHWDECAYAPDVHLMTSRELTSGFDFWSRGHLRMAVMHLSIKFGTYIFIHSRVIDIFPKSNMAAAAILDFQGKWIWHIPAYWECSAWALYQTWFKYLM